MRALVFERYGGPEVLQYKEVGAPVLGPGEVLVEVRAAAQNYNDIWARRGAPLAVALPHISGSDVAGVVHEVGAGVSTVSEGDEILVHPGRSCRVCRACTQGEEFFCRKFQLWGFETGPLDGGHAELCKIQEAQAVPKPSSLTFEEAASFPLVLETAWRMLVTRARLQPNEYVLIWGAAGGLGMMAIQIATAMGARPVAVVSTKEKAKVASEFGAFHVINRSKEDVLGAVGRLTDKRGADVVFEHTGQATWEASVKACRYGGRIVVCGATSGYGAKTDLRFLWNKQQSHLGSHLASRADLEAALELVEVGLIHPLIDDVLPLSEAPRAQKRMEEGKTIGKVVFIP